MCGNRHDRHTTLADHVNPSNTHAQKTPNSVHVVLSLRHAGWRLTTASVTTASRVRIVCIVCIVCIVRIVRIVCIVCIVRIARIAHVLLVLVLLLLDLLEFIPRASVM
jgi:hypothetical protein